MTETKAKIIAAAEELFAEKGGKATKIADIAGKAGVVDSNVYLYFKGKQDLLFSVAYERIVEALALLKEHLQGISEPWSKLGKMVWYSLRYNDQHPDFTRILLFECRSNKNYYTSPAYTLMRQHAGILLEILQQGAAQGAFRTDINMALVRDLIYGTIDFETISCLAAGEIVESSPDLERIMTVLRKMLEPAKEQSEEDKEEKILAAAEKAFARHGYANTKVTDIARLAQVAEGTLYEYFRNKEDLLLSIPARRFQEHLAKMPEAFHIVSPLRKLRRFMRYHFSLYLPNRDFLKVFLLDVQLNPRFYKSSAYNGYRKYLSTFEEIIREGQADNSFRSDIDARIIRNMFLGAFSHMALRWIMLDTSEDLDKMEEIDEVINLFAESISAGND
jgi:TetR/AcrR family fatty acid metabolism transcriptional regulator